MDAIERKEVRLPLLVDERYHGMYYLGNCYFIGLNHIVRYNPDTGVSEVIFSGTLPNTYGCGANGKYIWCSLTTPGVYGNTTLDVHLFDCVTGQYTPNYKRILLYSDPAWAHGDPKTVELIQYDKVNNRFHVFFEMYYRYPVPYYDKYRVTIDATTLEKVAGTGVGWGDYIPSKGQFIEGFYFGKFGGDVRVQPQRVAEWGSLSSDSTMGNAVTDASMTYGLCGFYRGGKVYFVGGSTYNHTLTEMDTTTRIKRTLFEGEPFANCYALDAGDTYYVGGAGYVISYKFVPYENTFTIYDTLGATLASISDLPTVKSISLHASGDLNQDAALTLIDIFDQAYTLYFHPSHTRPDNAFIGLAMTPSQNPAILVGQVYDIPLETSNFYAVYGDPTPVNVCVAYKMSCEKNQVFKADSLTEVARYNGTFRNTISITDPVFTITNLGMPEFNYIWIRSLNRYYFVTDIINIRANLWEIHAHVDVLYTYRNSIVGLSAHATRSEAYGDPQLVDAAVPSPVFSDISLQMSYLYEGEENPLDPLTSTGHYYLLTAIRKE